MKPYMLSPANPWVPFKKIQSILSSRLASYNKHVYKYKYKLYSLTQIFWDIKIIYKIPSWFFFNGFMLYTFIPKSHCL